MPQLTVEKLKALKFRLKQHMNGGSEWSGIVRDNEEYGLVYQHRTDGRPHYKYTERTIQTEDGAMVIDLLAEDVAGQIRSFVEKYNQGSRTQD